MKLAQMSRDGELRLCLFEGDRAIDLNATAAAAGIALPRDMRGAIARMDDLEDMLRAALPYAVYFAPEGARFENVLNPPGKLLCVGTNYRKHLLECNMPFPSAPVLFGKFANAFAAHGQEIKIPAVTQKADYECELVLVVGKGGKDIPRDRALSHLFGYTCGNDLSARDLQFVSNQWLIGKTPDSFAPAGPWIVTADEVPDPGNIDMKLWVNGVLRQQANTRDLIVDIRQMISIASSASTLYPGDLIATGTPAGVDKVVDGDVITIEVAHVGRMSVPVVQSKLGANIVFEKPYEFARAH